VKKAQYTSPIIILSIIIISTVILLAETRLNKQLEEDNKDYGIIINDIEEETNKELEYENNLTHKTLDLLSTINNTITINDILSTEDAKITGTEPKVVLEYSTRKTIIVPYPYAELLREELRFDKGTFKDCMKDSCNNFQECTDNYDTGTSDWEPIICVNNPLRVKINIKNREYSLTNDYPYHLWNDSYMLIT
jgi:hypothetical protein